MNDQMIGGKYIEKKIRTPKAAGPAIIPFITAGYPNTEDFNQTLHEIAKTLNPSNSQSLCVAFFINFVFPSNEITASLTLEEMQF